VILPLRVQSRLAAVTWPILLAVSTAVWGMASAGRVPAGGCGLAGGLVDNTMLGKFSHNQREAKISGGRRFSRRSVSKEGGSEGNNDLDPSDQTSLKAALIKWWPACRCLNLGSQISGEWGPRRSPLGLGVKPDP